MPTRQFDTHKAQQLLDKAGWKASSKEGSIREKRVSHLN